MIWLFLSLAVTAAILVLDTARRVRNMTTQPVPVRTK